MKLTYGRFLMYIRQISRVIDWENGEDPDVPRALTQDEFIKALLAGRITPDYHKKRLLANRKDPKSLTDEDKKLIADSLKEQLFPGFTQIIRDRIKPIGVVN